MNKEKSNLILKAIYFGSTLVDDKYRNFNSLNLNGTDCGSMGIQILTEINFPNLKILKLNGSKMTSIQFYYLIIKCFLIYRNWI